MRWTLLLASCLLCASCASDEPDLHAVTGVVTLDGAPVEHAEVMFSPQSGTGRTCLAHTDAQGKFVLRFTSSAAGAPLGTYSVTVSKVIPNDEVPNDPGKELLPRKYQRPDTTVVEIVSGPNEITLDLKSK